MHDEVAGPVTHVQLLGENAVPAGTAGIGRARQAAHQSAVGEPGQGAGLHGRSADVGHGDLPEQLAEAIDLLVQQAGDGFRSAVATGEAGAAGDQDHLTLIVGDPLRHLGANLVQIVLEQYTRIEPVAGCAEAIDEQLARGVGFHGSGIADRQDGNIEGHEGYICLGFHWRGPVV